MTSIMREWARASKVDPPSRRHRAEMSSVAGTGAALASTDLTKGSAITAARIRSLLRARS
jgi:hypothetical protein